MRTINVEWQSTPALQNVMSHWSMTDLSWAMEMRCKSPNAPAVRAKSNRQTVVVRRWRATISQQSLQPKTCLKNLTIDSRVIGIIIFWRVCRLAVCGISGFARRMAPTHAAIASSGDRRPDCKICCIAKATRQRLAVGPAFWGERLTLYHARLGYENAAHQIDHHQTPDTMA